MQAQREYPPDMQCKDKFLVQSVISEIGSPKDITPDLVSELSKSAGRISQQVSARVNSEVRSSGSQSNTIVLEIVGKVFTCERPNDLLCAASCRASACWRRANHGIVKLF